MPGSAEGPMPVTLLTGFLGSGKTTLLNRILTEEHGMRIAVIENEFGEIDIDSDLIVDAAEEIVEMRNGCVCCTVRSDLIEALEQLRQRRSDFDHIVVESTGLADPGPVVQTFFIDESVRSWSKLTRIVTVVDAKNFCDHAEQFSEVENQVAAGDVVVVNKADLVDEDRMRSVVEKVLEINPATTIHQVTRAAVSVGDVFDPETASSVERLVENVSTAADATPHGHAHEAIGSVSLELDADLDGQSFCRWLGDLLYLKWRDIYRMKGVLAMRGVAQPVIVQGVHMLVDADAGERWGDRGRGSRLVIIGRGLDAAALSSGFASCSDRGLPSPRLVPSAPIRFGE